MKTYQALDEKPYASEYLYHETILEFPVVNVWPHALNIGGWMIAHDLSTIDGAPGLEGHFERVYPRNLGEDTPEPRYHLYGVAHVMPHRLIALEVFPEAGGSYGGLLNKTSFDSIILTDMGEQTHLAFLMIDVLLSPAGARFEHSEGLEARRVRLRHQLDEYFGHLRGLIAGGVRDLQSGAGQ